MIQRIQTLYLLAVVALMSVTLFAPIATFTVGETTFTLSAFSLAGGNQSQSTLWMGILLVVSTVRLCGAEVVLLLGALVFIGIYYWLSVDKAFDGIEIMHKQFGWAAPMPLVSIVLTYLAGRAIFKDEILVRSLDRIR